jgi:tetratricopeptide (TPR) repeat protein
MSRLPASFAKHMKPVRQPAMRPAAAKNGIEEALRRAKEHYDRGEVKQAEQLCIAVLARDPRNAQALLMAGALARAVGDLGLALQFFKKLVEFQPNAVEARLQLAATCGEAHEQEDAIKHFKHVLALRPESVAALGSLGKSYIAAGQAELALPLFEKATKLEPSHPALRCDHADALIALGRMDEATTILKDSIRRGYRISACYRSLAETRKFSNEPAELAEILGKLDQPNPTKIDLVLLNHAAGKILNDLGRHEEAIDHFQEGKIAAGHGFDIDAYRRQVDGLIAAFTPALLKSKAGFGSPSEIPVFIVGMPRSGTTLTEQICASHPAVHGAGELNKLGTVIRSAGYTQTPNGSIQKHPQGMRAEEARSIAASYLDFVQRMAPSSARIVDKMPHNFKHVGMIALLFPDAKIIHCTRDPIDNSISCFFNTFNDKHGYNTDLRTLGLYYREYDRLMKHWHALLPGRIYECNYETMIADQEAESRRLIDFLGLPWDDACLRFYDTDRSVNTPSRWQVRQPIYASSVKRWKKYENKIQPLIEALGDLAVTEDAPVAKA